MTYHVSSGQVSSGIVLAYDSMHVSSNGTVDSTVVNSRGYLGICGSGRLRAISARSW